jgi:hypothetical protein
LQGNPILPPISTISTSGSICSPLLCLYDILYPISAPGTNYALNKCLLWLHEELRSKKQNEISLRHRASSIFFSSHFYRPPPLNKWFERIIYGSSYWASVTYTYNPGYSVGRDQEDHGSKPACANSSQNPISKMPNTKKGQQSD